MSTIKVNLIISTYGAKYNHEDKENYLRLNLLVLNKLNPNITTISIMKPKINNNHIAYKNYYNFDDIDLKNIRHKIDIIECYNIGISYGQFLTAIYKEQNYDYYIFIEDDYN